VSTEVRKPDCQIIGDVHRAHGQNIACDQVPFFKNYQACGAAAEINDRHS
jgi:hypothetical protein